MDSDPIFSDEIIRKDIISKLPICNRSTLLHIDKVISDRVLTISALTNQRPRIPSRDCEIDATSKRNQELGIIDVILRKLTLEDLIEVRKILLSAATKIEANKRKNSLATKKATPKMENHEE